MGDDADGTMEVLLDELEHEASALHSEAPPALRSVPPPPPKAQPAPRTPTQNAPKTSSGSAAMAPPPAPPKPPSPRASGQTEKAEQTSGTKGWVSAVPPGSTPRVPNPSAPRATAPQIPAAPPVSPAQPSPQQAAVQAQAPRAVAKRPPEPPAAPDSPGAIAEAAPPASEQDASPVAVSEAEISEALLEISDFEIPGAGIPTAPLPPPPPGQSRVQERVAPPASADFADPIVEIPRGTSDAPGVFEAPTPEKSLERWLQERDDCKTPERRAALSWAIARALPSTLEDSRRDEALAAVLADSPDSLDALEALRRRQSLRGKTGAAVTLVEEELRLCTDVDRRGALLRLQGHLEERRGRRAEAEASYRKALEVAPKDLAALRALQNLVLSDGEKLIEVLQLRIQGTGSPELKALLLCRQAALIESDSPAKAIALLEQALNTDPRCPTALGELKRLYEAEHRWPELANALAHEAALAPDGEAKARAQYHRARILWERVHQADAALSALLEADAASTDSPLILEERTRLLEREERWPELAEVLQRRHALAPPDSEERFVLARHLGDVLLRGGSLEHAVAWFEAARALRPTDVPTLQSLARLHQRAEAWHSLIAVHQGEAEATEDSLRRALAHARIAEIHEHRLKSPDDAVTHHQLALASDPAHDPSVRALLRLLRAQQRWAQLVAFTEERATAATDPDDALALLHDAAVLLEDNLGDIDGATRCYRQALRLVPGDRRTLRALQRTLRRAEQYPALVEAIDDEAATVPSPSRRLSLWLEAAEIAETHLDDVSGALARYRKVLAEAPKHPAATRGLGRLFHRLQRWDELREAYEAELALETKGSADGLGLLHKLADLQLHQLGDRKQAEACLRRALLWSPGHLPSLRALQRSLQDSADWAGLCEAFAEEAKHTKMPEAQARLQHQIGALREERMDDAPGAQRAYQNALGLWPEYRPAADALIRLHTQRSQWSALATVLRREATPGEGEAPNALHFDALLRLSALYAGPLRRPKDAVSSLEELLASAPDHLGALVALDELHGRGNDERRQELILRQATLLQGSEDGMAALREALRWVSPDSAEAQQALRALLEAAPNDPQGLDLLAERLESGAAADGIMERLEAGESRDTFRAELLRRRAAQLETEGDATGAWEALVGAQSLGPRDQSIGAAMLRVAGRDPQRRSAAHGVAAQLAADAEVQSEHLCQAAAAERELGNTDAATTHALEALRLTPGHGQPRTVLTELLEETSPGTLREHLHEAALSASGVDQGELWLEVARLEAGPLRRPTAALHAARQALESTPQSMRAHHVLGACHLRLRQWAEAASHFADALALCEGADSDDGELRTSLLLSLGGLQLHRLNQLDAAAESFAGALSEDEALPEALAGLCEVHRRRGEVDAALEVVARWRQAVADASAVDQANVLVVWARLLGGAPSAPEGALRDEALPKLLEAVALGGPEHDAAALATPILERTPDWPGYRDALREHLANSGDPRAQRRTLEALAAVLQDRLGDHEQALTALHRAIGLPGDPQRTVALRKNLAERQERCGKVAEATATLRALIADDAQQTAVWRHLFGLLASTRSEEARPAAEALSLFGMATAETEGHLELHPPRLPHELRPGACGQSILDRLSSPGETQRLVTSILRLCRPSLGKLFPSELSAFGLGSRDKLSPRQAHPLRQHTEHLAQTFGIEDFEVYLHHERKRGVVSDPTHAARLLVPASLGELPASQASFALGEALASIALGEDILWKLTAREVQVLLAAVGRIADHRFGRGLTSEDVLNEQSKRLHKAVGRRNRGELESLAEQYIKAPRIDFERFARSARRTARRAALLVADDLQSALREIGKQREFAGFSESALLGDPQITDLIAFWGSQAAAVLRRQLTQR